MGVNEDTLTDADKQALEEGIESHQTELRGVVAETTGRSEADLQEEVEEFTFQDPDDVECIQIAEPDDADNGGMYYVYAALMLNEAGTEITTDSITAVLEAANVNVNESRAKALVAALEDVDIDEAAKESGAAATHTSVGQESPADTDRDDRRSEPADEEEADSDEEFDGLFG